MILRIAAACIALMGCTPETTLALAKGAGSMTMTQDGQTGWRYVVPENAYRGVVDDPAQIRAQHEYLIGAWLAEGGNCRGGFKTDSMSSVQGMAVYEGRCR